MQDTATVAVDEVQAVFEKQNNQSKSGDAWDWSIALVKMAGLSPTPDFLSMVEQEKRGEITTADIKKCLDKKYKIRERD